MRGLLQLGTGLLCGGALAGSAMGQAVPAETRSPSISTFSVPSLSGSLRYSMSASERLTFGYNGANATNSVATISGNTAYLSQSVNHPFSLIYSGGYLASTSSQPSAFFQNLQMSQVVDLAHWNFTVSDQVSYLPETATTGLSGLPGLGDLGAGSPIGQDVLTRFATRVENAASGSLTRKLTGSTSVEGTGSYTLQRFLNAQNALETNQVTASGGINHRLDARSSVSGSYSYSTFSYVGVDGTFGTQGVSAEYSRQITRKLRFDVSGGPQRVSGNRLTGRGPTLNYTADVHAMYIAEDWSTGVDYTRATNGGSGVTLGARSDSLRGSVSRRLGRSLSGTGVVSYGHMNSLAVLTLAPLSTSSVVGSGQFNRALGTSLSVYASYTAQKQISQGIDLTGLSINGFSQILGFGLTYSPPLLRFAH